MPTCRCSGTTPNIGEASRLPAFGGVTVCVETKPLVPSKMSPPKRCFVRTYAAAAPPTRRITMSTTTRKRRRIGRSCLRHTLRNVEEPLLAWFDQHGRDLPWRRTRDPYAILVSEVMAQQTQLERVLPRWERWMERWPTIESLAVAPAADVIRAWQGLGYNRRALAIHDAAKQIAAHGWPDDLT